MSWRTGGSTRELHKHGGGEKGQTCPLAVKKEAFFHYAISVSLCSYFLTLLYYFFKALAMLWTLRRKSHLMWSLRRNLFADMDSSRSTKGPKSMTNKSLEAICWQGLLTYSTYWEDPQTEFSASCASRGVQPLGFSGPHWKKSCLGPHIKYIVTRNHT